MMIHTIDSLNVEIGIQSLMPLADIVLQTRLDVVVEHEHDDDEDGEGADRPDKARDALLANARRRGSNHGATPSP